MPQSSTDHPAAPDIDGSARSARALDRLANFSDAVVAIAITLVALPLVDIAQNAPSTRIPPGAWFLQQHGAEIGAAALSFAVIGGFWLEHHAEWGKAVRSTRVLVLLDLGWLGTVMFLPIPTVLLFRSTSHDPVTLALYIGTMLANLILSRCMQIEIELHASDRNRSGRDRLRGVLRWVPVALLIAALIVAVTMPVVGTRALLILLLTIPITAIAQRLHHFRPTA